MSDPDPANPDPANPDPVAAYRLAVRRGRVRIGLAVGFASALIAVLIVAVPIARRWAWRGEVRSTLPGLVAALDTLESCLLGPARAGEDWSGPLELWLLRDRDAQRTLRACLSAFQSEGERLVGALPAGPEPLPVFAFGSLVVGDPLPSAGHGSVFWRPVVCAELRRARAAVRSLLDALGEPGAVPVPAAGACSETRGWPQLAAVAPPPAELGEGLRFDHPGAGPIWRARRWGRGLLAVEGVSATGLPEAERRFARFGLDRYGWLMLSPAIGEPWEALAVPVNPTGWAVPDVVRWGTSTLVAPWGRDTLALRQAAEWSILRLAPGRILRAWGVGDEARVLVAGDTLRVREVAAGALRALTPGAAGPPVGEDLGLPRTHLSAGGALTLIAVEQSSAGRRFLAVHYAGGVWRPPTRLPVSAQRSDLVACADGDRHRAVVGGRIVLASDDGGLRWRVLADLGAGRALTQVVIACAGARVTVLGRRLADSITVEGNAGGYPLRLVRCEGECEPDLLVTEYARDWAVVRRGKGLRILVDLHIGPVSAVIFEDAGEGALRLARAVQIPFLPLHMAISEGDRGDRGDLYVFAPARSSHRY